MGTKIGIKIATVNRKALEIKAEREGCQNSSLFFGQFVQMQLGNTHVLFEFLYAFQLPLAQQAGLHPNYFF